MLTLDRIAIGITDKPRTHFMGGMGIKLPRGKALGVFLHWPKERHGWLVLAKSDIFVGHDDGEYTNVWTSCSSESVAESIVNKLAAEDPKGSFEYIHR